MHQGTSVITANVSSLPEVGGDAVLYCDPAKTGELADAMRRLLDDEDLRHSLSKRGLQRAMIFSNQVFADELMGRVVTLAKPQAVR
jgi:glycosyltransferase involved in cell wall biosynthesis